MLDLLWSNMEQLRPFSTTTVAELSSRAGSRLKLGVFLTFLPNAPQVSWKNLDSVLRGGVLALRKELSWLKSGEVDLRSASTAVCSLSFSRRRSSMNGMLLLPNELPLKCFR